MFINCEYTLSSPFASPLFYCQYLCFIVNTFAFLLLCIITSSCLSLSLSLNNTLFLLIVHKLFSVASPLINMVLQAASLLSSTMPLMVAYLTTPIPSTKTMPTIPPLELMEHCDVPSFVLKNHFLSL